MQKAPVALFCYNRPDHLRITLRALSENVGAKDTPLYVFCDGPKTPEDHHSVSVVRQLVMDFHDAFARVERIDHENNIGLARSIIQGVTHVLKQHETVIVFEDDLRSHPNSLAYFNSCLEAFHYNMGVFSISGYSFPQSLFALPANYPYDAYWSARMQCWGWATWRDRWNKASFDIPEYDAFMADPYAISAYKFWIGQDSFGTLERCMRHHLDVWACRWVYAHFKNHALCLCPKRSYIDNIGLDGSGSNCAPEDRRRNTLEWEQPKTLRLPIHAAVDMEIHKAFQAVFNPTR